MVAAFFHGLVLAFGLILPLGVQNVFVFNQGALQKQLFYALPVVVTASLCDTLLISLSVLGVSFVVFGSFWMKSILLSAGVLFLLYMGWSTWKSTPAKIEADDNAMQRFTPRRQIAFAASVSLLNPHAIMDTVGVIGTSSLQYAGVEKMMFALASILVSWLWFFGLALAGRMTGQLDPTGRVILVLNKASALVMWGAAIYIGISSFRN